MISYCHVDVDAAKALDLALSEFGFRVWWDAQLYAGKPYHKEIDARIRSVDFVIVLWSKASSESTWVLGEAALAYDLGKILPIKIEVCDLKAPFNGLHTLNVLWNENTGSFERLDVLVGALKSIQNLASTDESAISDFDLSATSGLILLTRALRARTLDSIKDAAVNDRVFRLLYGIALLEGVGIAKDVSLAVQQFESCAKAGLARALNSLSVIATEGLNGKKTFPGVLDY